MRLLYPFLPPPCSVMLWPFEGQPYLLVGLGDGLLHHWKMSEETGAPSAGLAQPETVSL